MTSSKPTKVGSFHSQEKERKMVRTKPKIVHVIATCQECSWKNEDFKTAQRQARLHSYKTGHSVHVEVGRSYTVQSERNCKMTCSTH